MAPRTCVTRLERWLAAEGARLEPVRYRRPEAGGDVSAFRLIPRELRARVVAAHGAGNDALYPQVALFKAFVRRGFEVFSFDIDGHGAESTTTFSVPAVESAVAAAVEQAEAGRDDLPLHLLGHSLGGSLVLAALASGQVPHAASAIIISSPISVTVNLRNAMGELRGFLRRVTLGQREHYGLWGLVPAFGPVKRGAYPFRGEPAKGGPFGYVAAFQRLLARLDLERTAAEVRVPVLLVYGTADHLVPPEQGRRLVAVIPRAELVPVQGGSHWSTAFADLAVERAAGWIEAHRAVAA